jgi:peroxiredoxin
MKRAVITSLLAIAGLIVVNAGLKPGDTAKDFTLKNVDGKTVSLSDYSDQKGVILVFTCNTCPFAKAYEDRIIQLHKKYAGQGFPVVAINSNDGDIQPGDTFENMKERADEKGFQFAYLKDDQRVFEAYGATRTPHVFLLEKKGARFRVAYIGAIDDNAMDASDVNIKKYLENAVSAVMSGSTPSPAITKAVGCTIKTKT